MNGDPTTARHRMGRNRDKAPIHQSGLTMRGAASLQRFPKIDQVLLGIFAERAVIGAKFQQAGERGEARCNHVTRNVIHFLIWLIADQNPLICIEYQKPYGQLVERTGQSLALYVVSTTKTSHDTNE